MLFYCIVRGQRKLACLSEYITLDFAFALGVIVWMRFLWLPISTMSMGNTWQINKNNEERCEKRKWRENEPLLDTWVIFSFMSYFK
jgi:heme/copper-type cytochrome/quinol oxidase subunit 2